MKSLLIFGLTLLSTGLWAQKADDIVGLWLVESKDAYIRIFEKNDLYFGKVTWIEEPYDEEGKPRTDPDGEPVLDMEIMKNFEFDGEEWIDGTVYDAKEGKTYYGSIEMEDKNTLKLRGSVDSFGILGRTETWTRLEEK
ncbi:MAG TPA: DUF2147 domain-containing protein [Cryomorphaceae bacterium]|nr:DUF2147 domain-containing protein [Cryomorphaceae bacterium]